MRFLVFLISENKKNRNNVYRPYQWSIRCRLLSNNITKTRSGGFSIIRVNCLAIILWEILYI